MAAAYSLRSALEDMRGAFGALWQGRRWIAATTLLFALPVAVWLIITPSEYEATAQIMLDPRPTKLVEGAVVQNNLGQSSVGADTLLVDSQTEIITSRPVLGKVVEAHKLEKDPEFYKPRGLGIRMRLRNLVGAFLPGFRPERVPATGPADVALVEFRDKHLFVHRVGNTYVINVSVLSTDPEKAAGLANAVAESYIADQVAFLAQTTRAATTDLEARIKQLRERVRVAEDKVEEFRKSHDLLGGPGLLSTEQRLQDLNSKVAEARAKTALAKARYERLSEGTAESVAAGNTSEALDNKVIVNLRALLAQAERRLSGLSGELGPAHPSLKRAREERASILRLIGQELERIRAVAKSEYELARANEASLAAELTSAQESVADNKAALVTLRELEREAEAAKAVLETFLVRVRETSEQESLSRASSRIIAPAAVPQRPSYPPTKLLAAAALFCGFVAGALLVWIRHIMSAPVPMPAGTASFVATIDEEGRLLDPPASPPGDEILAPEVLDAFQARLDELQRRARNYRP